MTSMLHSARSSQADADDTEVILGVDTHKDTHVAAVLNPVGVLLDSRWFAATAAGYQQLLGWVQAFGTPRRAGVEGTGSYGAALSRHLQTAGVQVFDVNQSDKATRRRRGKTDAIDAEAAARAVLAGRATATATTGDGPVEMARMFKLAKDAAVKSRTQAINQLKAVLVVADPALRESLSGLSSRVLSADARSSTPVCPPTPPAPRPGPSGCWPTGSGALPRRSTTSTPASPRR